METKHIYVLYKKVWIAPADMIHPHKRLYIILSYKFVGCYTILDDSAPRSVLRAWDNFTEQRIKLGLF